MINGKHVTSESVEYSSFTVYHSLFFVISYSLFLFQISFSYFSTKTHSHNRACVFCTRSKALFLTTTKVEIFSSYTFSEI